MNVEYTDDAVRLIVDPSKLQRISDGLNVDLSMFGVRFTPSNSDGVKPSSCTTSKHNVTVETYVNSEV